MCRSLYPKHCIDVPYGFKRAPQMALQLLIDFHLNLTQFDLLIFRLSELDGKPKPSFAIPNHPTTSTSEAGGSQKNISGRARTLFR